MSSSLRRGSGHIPGRCQGYEQLSGFVEGRNQLGSADMLYHTGVPWHSNSCHQYARRSSDQDHSMYHGAEMARARSPEQLGMGADITSQRGSETSIQGTSGMRTVPSPEAVLLNGYDRPYVDTLMKTVRLDTSCCSVEVRARTK